MRDLINRLLQADYSQVPLFLVDTFRNPSQNPTAFILIVGGATVILALVIAVVIMLFLGGSDEEEEYDDSWDEAPTAQEPETQEYVEPPKRRPVLWGAIWVALFATVWVLAGTVSSDDAICTSCHVSQDLHAARDQKGTQDPHKTVACVSCHETPNEFARYTTALPGRAAHFVGGLVASEYAMDYGAPVPNRACSGCHGDAITVTTLDERRGVRMSHKEPLEARARCTDCHTVSEVGGIVGAFTVGMDPCLRCHDGENVSAECSYCHTKDVGAAVRTAGEIKARSHVAEMTCDGCHTDQTSCDNCHGIRMPHSTEFLGAGHARAGVEDIWYNGGKGCKRCHTANRRPCGRCHSSPFPGHTPADMIRTHKTLDPYRNGCDGCHGSKAWIQGRNFCGNCHDEYKQPFQ